MGKKIDGFEVKPFQPYSMWKTTDVVSVISFEEYTEKYGTDRIRYVLRGSSSILAGEWLRYYDPHKPFHYFAFQTRAGKLLRVKFEPRDLGEYLG